MSAGFQVRPLQSASFSFLSSMTTEQLDERGIVRSVVDGCPGYPCRISLQDRPVGEEIFLLNFEHQCSTTPYRARGPIFVGKDVQSLELPANTLPPFFGTRPISIRAYGTNQMMVRADVSAGPAVGPRFTEFFEDPEVSYIHAHFARQGCFACLVERA